MKHSVRNKQISPATIILKPIGGDNPIVVSPPGVVLGRQSPPCVVPILHASVSRQHCQVDIGPDRILVTDMQSRNGTFVNGVPVTQTTLAFGDTLTCGQYEMLVSRYDDLPAPSP